MGHQSFYIKFGHRCEVQAVQRTTVDRRSFGLGKGGGQYRAVGQGGDISLISSSRQASLRCGFRHAVDRAHLAGASCGCMGACKVASCRRCYGMNEVEASTSAAPGMHRYLLKPGMPSSVAGRCPRIEAREVGGLRIRNFLRSLRQTCEMNFAVHLWDWMTCAAREAS